jgi:hypothetical protein
MEVKELGPIDNIFYKSPTELEIAKNGLYIAGRKSVLAAERKSSRILYGFMATCGSLVINMLNNPDTIGDFISNLSVPVATFLVGEIRTGKTQKREIRMMQSYPENVLNVLNQYAAEHLPISHLDNS